MKAELREIAPEAHSLPGRICPTSYRYSARDFDRDPEIVADTLYVVGGLYGNVEALEAVEALAAREPGPVTLAFNGDFHWFDVAHTDFARVTHAVLEHRAIRGNVETEIAAEDTGDLARAQSLGPEFLQQFNPLVSPSHGLASSNWTQNPPVCLETAF